jgi:two-component system chemotaxis sensor kinase CheA
VKTNAEQRAVYQQEANEQLSQVEELVLQLEMQPSDKEILNRLFRVFHTIKGSGAMFRFDEIARFTHHLETILDGLRKGRFLFDRRLAGLILRSKDCLEEMVGDPMSKADEALALEVRQFGEQVPVSASIAAPLVPVQGVAMEAPVMGGAPAAVHSSLKKCYRIQVRLAPGVLESGLEPSRLLDDLRSLGECRVEALLDELPHLEDLDPVECRLSWQVRLSTERDLNAIKDVFIFVEQDQGIIISEEVEAPVGPPARMPGAPGAVSEPFVPPQVEMHQTQPAAPAVVPAREEGPASVVDAVVKVPSSRLDQLVNLVGELVINHSRLQQLSKRQEQPELMATVEDLERLMNGLRDLALGIRMTPIGSTFVRYKRLVRDLAVELGKEVELVCEGEETELDKNMLDQLGEPLLHLIRNALDHGIGSPAERRSQGKPVQGVIRLSASHEGAHVIVRVQDDGQGLDRQAILERAVERGLLASGQELPDEELFSLIFLPGFSTARQVTRLSGRGVGMDVVKRQVEALRGSVSLSSQQGRGTSVTLLLPLTMAIIDGLLVGVGGDCYILPLSVVDENVEPQSQESATGNARNLIEVRDELVPFLHLGEFFGASVSPTGQERIVIVRAQGQRLGLVVDRIIGTHQTVVQGLGRFYRNVAPVSGATILGDGQVALILDVHGLVREISRRQALRSQPAA